MKKLFVLMLLVIGSFGLMACGGDDDTDDTDDTLSAQDIVDDAVTRSGALFVDTGSVTQGMNLPKAFMIDDNEVTVNWSSDNSDVVMIEETDANYRMTLDRPEFGEGNATVTVTASFEYDGATAERSWTLTIIELPDSDLYTNFADLHANASLNDNLEVEGIVVAKFSGGYFITDGTNQLGVYSGGLNAEIGDRVNLVGAYGSYYTLFQLTNVTETILESDVDFTLQKEELTVTEINALDSDENRLIPGNVYTVSALLEERTPGQYTNMFLIDGEEMAQIYHYGLSESLDALSENFLGQMVTLDVIYYTDHGDFVYLLFYGDETDVTSAELTDAEKAEFVKNGIDLGNTDLVLGDVTLPTTGDYDATISWASDNEAVVATDGTVTRPTDGDATVTLTATVTVGAESVTKDFTLLVKDASFVSTDVATAITEADGEIVFIEGIVTSVRAYGGGFFMEGTNGGVIFVQDLTDVEVGNLVTVAGTRDTFTEFDNERDQIIEATLVSNDEGDHSADITVITGMTLADIINDLPNAHNRRYRVENPVFVAQSEYSEMLFEGTAEMDAFFDIRNYGQYLDETLTAGDTLEFIEFTVYEISYGNLKMEGVEVPEEPAEAYTSISDLHANSELDDLVAIEGIVVAKFDGGYLITDNTNSIIVYNFDLTANIGDLVEVRGEYGSYYTAFQITGDVTETILDTDQTITLTPTVITVADLLALDSDADKTVVGSYFTITAPLEEHTPGQYTNMFLVDGSDMAQIYHYSPADSLTELEGYLDQTITIDVFYYTDHGDFIYLLFDTNAGDVTAE